MQSNYLNYIKCRKCIKHKCSLVYSTYNEYLINQFIFTFLGSQDDKEIFSYSKPHQGCCCIHCGLCNCSHNKPDEGLGRYSYVIQNFASWFPGIAEDKYYCVLYTIELCRNGCFNHMVIGSSNQYYYVKFCNFKFFNLPKFHFSTLEN